jgi:hypothetical protein
MPKILSSPRRPFTIHQAHRPHLATSAMGLDIIGPLPTAQGNLKFTFVAVEYFTNILDQGQSSLHDNSEYHPKILLAKHCLSFWSPVRANSRQRQTVRQPGLPGVPSAPSQSSPLSTTHNPTTSSNAPTTRFLAPSRKDSLTTKRANGQTNYPKSYER